MHKSRWQEYLKKQKDLFEEYSDIAFLKRQGQAEIEERIQNREPYTTYDQDTHGSIENFQEFLQNLKTITTNEAVIKLWGKNHHTDYRMPYEEFVSKCSAKDPVSGAILDYGEGFHKVTNNTMFRPGQDHDISQNNGAKKYGDIDNLEIINQRGNTIKNDSDLIDIIQLCMYMIKR